LQYGFTSSHSVAMQSCNCYHVFVVVVTRKEGSL
jgi:hypothetical protein